MSIKATMSQLGHFRPGGSLAACAGRIATRYDRLAVNYFTFIKLASIRVWLRVYESAA